MNVNGMVTNYIDNFKPALRKSAQVFAVYACAVLERLDDIRDGVTIREPHYVSRRPMSAVADAAGVALVRYEVPVGEGIQLISAACSGGSSTPSTGCFLYLGSLDNMNLIHVFDYGERFSDVFGGGEAVDSGGQLCFQFIGQPTGQLCTVNLKCVASVPRTVSGRAGEYKPPGLSNNSVATEIERHFPGALTDPDDAAHG